MKRVLTVQDLSCVGRCSLTVALPVLSVMGLETAILPTVLLSNHSAFSHFSFRDLTAETTEILRAWQAESLSFDGLYTGYLGGLAQVSLVETLLQRFPLPAEDGLLLVDPAMGDEGRLYAGLPAALPEAMLPLCRRAQFLTPNLTELCLLLGAPFPGEDCPLAQKQELLRRLGQTLSGPVVLLTGAGSTPEETGVLTYHPQTDRMQEYRHRRTPGTFPGTGDLFSSVLAGALFSGLPLETAIPLATNFVRRCLQFTQEDPCRRWYGLSFEAALPWLAGQTLRLREKKRGDGLSLP